MCFKSVHKTLLNEFNIGKPIEPDKVKMDDFT